MQLHYEKLRKCLRNMVDLQGIKPSQITQESNVYNIQKMIDGKNEPTVNSWWKLHKAFPKDISPPEYMNGKPIFTTTQSARRDMHLTAMMPQPLSTDRQMLMDLLDEKDPDRKIIRRFIAELLALT